MSNDSSSIGVPEPVNVTESVAGSTVKFTEALWSSNFSSRESLGLFVCVAFFGAIAYFGVRWIVRLRTEKAKDRKEAVAILTKMGLKDISLTETEVFIVLSRLVDTSGDDAPWRDIVGMEDVIQEVRETIIFPIQQRETFSGSQLVQPPKGVLLCGPVGCGKCTLARAIAAEAGARLIRLENVDLMDRSGNGEEVATAFFGLAIKVQPCIIFIKGIDGFLRTGNDLLDKVLHGAKSRFLRLWDDAIDDPKCQVIVMGTTRRPQDVDKFVLERMTSGIHVNVTEPNQQSAILRMLLENEVVSEDVDLDEIGKLAEGLSRGDLEEICRHASLCRAGNCCNENEEAILKTNASDLQPITMDDFLKALQKIEDSKFYTAIAS